MISNALVTGASGFLGRVLLDELTRRGVHTRTIGIEPSASHPEVPFQEVNLAQSSSLDRIEGGRDLVVFHLAGMAHQGLCEKNPGRAVEINVDGTLNVLEWCRRQEVQRVVFPSTGVIYGVNGAEAFSETRLPRPPSIYAATKLAAEALLEGHARTFGFSCVVARLANLYGCGASRDTVTSILLEQALRGVPLVVRSLSPIRDFLYVKDAAAALVVLAEQLGEPGFELFNVGTGNPTSIGQFAAALSGVLDRDPSSVRATEPEVGLAPSRLVLNVEKLRISRGWRPQWTLAAGIRDTLDEMRK